MLLWNFINSARTSLVLALSLAAMTTSTISTDSYAHRLSFFQKYVKLAVPFLGYGLMQFCKERSAAERLTTNFDGLTARACLIHVFPGELECSCQVPQRPETVLGKILLQLFDS